MTDNIITRAQAIDRMRDGLPCETFWSRDENWEPTQWSDFDQSAFTKFRIPPEPRREAREWWIQPLRDEPFDYAVREQESDCIHVREVLPDEVVVRRMTEAELSDWFWKWTHNGGGLEMHREPTRPDAVHNALQSLARALGLLKEDV